MGRNRNSHFRNARLAGGGASWIALYFKGV